MALDIEPEKWAALNRLLDQALDRPPEERQAWLEELPADCDHLKPHLERILARDSPGAAGFLETLPKVGGAGVAGSVGETFGPYRLKRLLAEGGMGAVWLAERHDGMVQRPLALKLPHGSWARAGLWERMAREREILASLNHPHIARLYDAGLSPDGQPYLALEYIEGLTIDAYVAEAHLDLRARLRLFLQVVEAVAHAHGQLVVHRDIKPSNVLVTEDGEVKLLDFGIAKLLEGGVADGTELTEATGGALTLAYASPEQVRGEPIGVASDVYSLSVVLYELLTGSRPYKPASESRGALEEAILHADPARSSDAAPDGSWRRRLKGDLDTLLSKGLKKDPRERYATANALGEDIERFLDGRPVLARADSAAYRVRKFMGRNRLAVGAATAILFAILGGAALAFWQARVAVAERERAEEVKDFIASVFQDANLEEGDGRSLSAIDLLKRAKARIDGSLGTSPEARVELLNIIGMSLLSLRDTATTEEVLNQAVEEADRAFGAEHIMTLRARLSRAWPLMYRGKTREVHEEIDAVLPILERHASAEPRDLVLAWRLRAHGSIEAGEYPEAETAAEQAHELAERGLDEDDPERLLALIDLATAYSFRQKPQAALDVAGRAHRRASVVYADNPRHPNAILARNEYARALGDNGDLEGAIEEFEGVLQDKIALYGPKNLTVGLTHMNLMTYQLDAGRLQAALENIERALAIFTDHTEPDSYSVATAVNARGVALLRARRGAQALPDYERTRAAAVRLFGPTHRNSLTTRSGYALALAYAGELDPALREAGSVLEEARRSGDVPLFFPLYVNGILRRLSGDHAGSLLLQGEALALARGEVSSRRDRDIRLDRARSLAEIGTAELEAGRVDAAIESLEEALRIFEGFRKVIAPDHADALVGLGRARIGRDELAEALPLLERADAFWRGFDPENRWAGEAALWLGRCHALSGREAEAGEALVRAERILSRSPLPRDADLVRGVRQSRSRPVLASPPSTQGG